MPESARGLRKHDPAVLKRIKKGISVERMTKFTADAKRKACGFTAISPLDFPAKPWRARKKTIEWACKMNPHMAQFQLMIPFPGTPFYDEMKQNGWLTESGEPDMPQFSNVQIRAMARRPTGRST